MAGRRKAHTGNGTSETETETFAKPGSNLQVFKTMFFYLSSGLSVTIETTGAADNPSQFQSLTRKLSDILSKISK